MLIDLLCGRLLPLSVYDGYDSPLTATVKLMGNATEFGVRFKSKGTETIEIGKDKRSPTRSEQRAIAACREDQTGHLPSVLKVAEGLGIPVTVTLRHQKEGTIKRSKWLDQGYHTRRRRRCVQGSNSRGSYIT